MVQPQSSNQNRSLHKFTKESGKHPPDERLVRELLQRRRLAFLRALLRYKVGAATLARMSITEIDQRSGELLKITRGSTQNVRLGRRSISPERAATFRAELGCAAGEIDPTVLTAKGIEKIREQVAAKLNPREIHR